MGERIPPCPAKAYFHRYAVSSAAHFRDVHPAPMHDILTLMIGHHRWIACLGIALALSGGEAVAQSRDPAPTPDPQRPPTIIAPPKPAPPPLPPASSERRDEPRADFCCTPYGRFGPVGGSGKPGAPCQWTLPSSVTQGSTCN